MSPAQKVEQAVLNNALWCDAMCRTHGISGEFGEAGWLNFKSAPPFYPNAITLGSAQLAHQHSQLVEEVIEAGLPGEWGVKGSFQTLDLSTSGFRLLFESQWIYKPATTLPSNDFLGVSWETITTPSALNEWEKAWAGDSDVEDLFVPELLKNEDVAIIAARRQGQIVAGCVASGGAGCVGISNMFLPAEQTQEFRQECIAKVQAIFPNLPLVGYEFGADLIRMEEVGFEAIGGLRVWLRKSTGQRED